MIITKALLAVLALFSLLATPSIAAVDGPYARHLAIGFGPWGTASKSVPRYSKFEVEIPFNADYANPFDSAAVRLDAHIAAPSGRLLTVPAFYMVDASRTLDGSTEHIQLVGKGKWLLRFSPSEVGTYTVVMTGVDHTGSANSGRMHFESKASSAHGFIKISHSDPYHFAFDDNTPYFAIGANVCWAGSRGTFDYDSWFPEYAANGANYARLWLSPRWMTFGLEQPGSAADGLGLGSFNMANAWRLDYVLNLAERNGLYLMLCTESYNVLREKDGYPAWEDSAQNAKNGGPLQRPGEFWTNPSMMQYYKNKLRYLVARYGYSTHVMSWEFWNEVDGVTEYDPAKVTAWHKTMAAALKAMDPYHHLRTTSFGNSDGLASVDKLPDLDYSQTHHYNSPDLVMPVLSEWQQKRTYGKPHYVGEIGENSGGPDNKLDPEGLQIHDPAWAAIGSGQAGTSMVWWWDSLIAPLNLYHLYRPMASFASSVDWGRERMHPISATSRDAVPSGKHGDLQIPSGPISWAPAPYNQPVSVEITPAGYTSSTDIAGLMHGIVNHKDLHNPATFHFNLPWASTFTTSVSEVSGFGGAAIAISLDGKSVVTKAFPDNHGDGVNPHKNTETFSVEVPAGRHTVVVEDTGADWFYVSYLLRGALKDTGPPMLIAASTGTHTTVLWARVIGRTAARINLAKEAVPPAPSSIVTLQGLKPGKWSGDVIDTWTGIKITSIAGVAGTNGVLTLKLSSIDKDIAVKLKHN